MQFAFCGVVMFCVWAVCKSDMANFPFANIELDDNNISVLCVL